MNNLFLQLLLNATPVIFAAILHMVVVKMRWFDYFTYPLDHYKTYNGKRYFGKNKTYRGVLVMIVGSIFFTYLYLLLIKNHTGLRAYNLLTISTFSFIKYGLLFGIGYIIGELPNSFYKRQLNVESGKSHGVLMKIIDQLDSVIIIMILLVIYSNFTWIHFLVGIFFYGMIHIIINYLLYKAGIRKEPF